MSLVHFLKNILFNYSWGTEREADKQAEGEAGSMQEARCGTQSWDSGITPWAKGKCSTIEPPRHPPPPNLYSEIWNNPNHMSSFAQSYTLLCSVNLEHSKVYFSHIKVITEEQCIWTIRSNIKISLRNALRYFCARSIFLFIFVGKLQVSTC